MRVSMEKVFLLVALLCVEALPQPKQELLPVLKYYQGESIDSGLETTPESFVLNGKNLTLYSGAIHYFRVHPNYWDDRLAKLSAAGLVAVETYVPWNLHEPQEGVFDFGNGGNDLSPFLNLELFIQKAFNANLLVILRPGPYICAEWEFGGLPSWLLRIPGLTVRTSDEKFTSKVKAYYDQLMPIVNKWQFINGGPIIAFQIENEYGSTGNNDKDYLSFIHNLMMSHGVQGLFFTSDSPASSGDRGSLPGVLQTANFQADPETQLNALKALQPDKPAMVMEYWTGWFDHWLENGHHTTTVEYFSDVLRRIITFPSNFNLYMFIGGTSWGFMNGANVQGSVPTYSPDVTSYDYDAPLSEAGDYTEKYTAVQQLVDTYSPIKFLKPDPPPESVKVAYPNVQVIQQLDLNELVDQVPPEDRVTSPEVMPMELLDINNGNGQSYGFVLYRRKDTTIGESSVLQINEHVRDVAIVLLDGQRKTEVFTNIEQIRGFGYWEQADAQLTLDAESAGVKMLDILVENWGRNNFGSLTTDFNQFKGIVSGPVLIDGTELTNWEIIALQFKGNWIKSLTNWKQFSGEPISNPTLFKTTLEVTEPNDTFLDMRAWGKGIVFLNGFTLGRYFSAGPLHSLYIPAPLLQQGTNEILVFELYTPATEISFSDVPILS